jgi:hypothetical protein
MTANQKYRKIDRTYFLYYFFFFRIEMIRSNLTIHDGWLIDVV